MTDAETADENVQRENDGTYDGPPSVLRDEYAVAGDEITFERSPAAPPSEEWVRAGEDASGCVTYSNGTRARILDLSLERAIGARAVTSHADEWKSAHDRAEAAERALEEAEGVLQAWVEVTRAEHGVGRIGHALSMTADYFARRALARPESTEEGAGQEEPNHG